uniref:MATH domain-containing protein n=1 Tax=Guillardia theta TaxID=55529 RepID=A0A7S4PRR9_GUITH
MNDECERDQGDPENPDRITSQSFASVELKMQPIPQFDEDAKGKNAGQADAEEGEDEDDDASIASSAASLATEASTKPGGTKSRVSSRALSQRSEGKRSFSKNSATSSKMGQADANGVVLPPCIERSLSQLFTNREPSWGFEKLFDIGKLYNWREGYMLEYGKNRERVQDGHITLEIIIFAASGLRLEEPQLEPELTLSGRQRVNWVIHDLKRVVAKIGPNKKLSSAEFTCDGEWYLDLFPSGYRTEEPETISIYLHSSRRQVELGFVSKVWFRFGLKKVNPTEEEQDDPKYENVWFPPGSSCVSTFTPSKKCFGKQNAFKVSDIVEGRNGNKKLFLYGKYDAGGAVAFVLDLLITDDESWQVQHMLHEIEAFGYKQNRCNETGEELKADWLPGGGKVICYHCGKAFSKEVTNYQARMEEFGYEIGREYITDILMREDEHWLDGVLRAVNIPDRIDQAVKSITHNIARMRLKKEQDEEEDHNEDEIDEGNMTLEQKSKKEKEKALQKKFEDKIKALRLEVEDSHFSKPVCSKCAEKRKALQACKEIYANEPPEKRGNWQCPDQNALTTLFPDGSEAFVPRNARKQSQEKNNFRSGWKGIWEIYDKKYQGMKEAMAQINIKGDAVLHAADEWIKKRLGRNKDMNPADLPGRNALTLVRGNRFVEPMELCRQCNGRVNRDGITPDEDEDAPKDYFCDVRFDVVKPPKAIYCLYSGKIFCEFCADPKKHLYALPQFEMNPSQAELVQVSQNSLEVLQKTVTRIQPVSKKEEEEIVPKGRRNIEVEEEDGDDEPAFITLFRKFPICGNQIADKLADQIAEWTGE